MKRIALAVSVLVLGGCASYYDDRYYYADDGYYYEDGYHPRSSYARRYYRTEPYYYDLYDPYLALFSPFGWIYDPWYHHNYRFGVDLYPFRNFGFAFYGGRPWHYSPWYSGYGLYHPYGYYQPQPQRGQGHQERATDAARGLALGVQSAGATVVRASAISAPGNSTLLGTMSLPAAVNGIPVSRDHGYVPGSTNLRSEAIAVDSSRGFQRAEPSGYRDQGIPLSRAQFPPTERGWLPRNEAQGINGIPAGQFESSQNLDAPTTRWRSTEAYPQQQGYPGGGERLQRRDAPAGWSGGENRSQAIESPQHWQAPAGMPDRGGYGREQRAPEVRSAPREYSAPREHREPSSGGRDFGIPSRDEHPD